MDGETDYLPPNQHFRLRFNKTRGLLRFRVRADHPVETFIVRPGGLARFDRGEDSFKYYGGFSERMDHGQTLKLPFNGVWYLLIVNRSKTQGVNVEYEVELV